MNDFAACLARFLIALQQIDTTEAPLSESHNFYRGGILEIYDAETRQAIELLKENQDTFLITKIWETALSSTWQDKPVWVHGDVSANNLLVKDGELKAVIDFGGMSVGDPACDLAIAWTLFDRKSRDVFRSTLSLDNDTWARGRGWTLWKALIVVTGLTETNAIDHKQSWRIIQDVMTDYNCGL